MKFTTLDGSLLEGVEFVDVAEVELLELLRNNHNNSINQNELIKNHESI